MDEKWMVYFSQKTGWIIKIHPSSVIGFKIFFLRTVFQCGTMITTPKKKWKNHMVYDSIQFEPLLSNFNFESISELHLTEEPFTISSYL